MIIDSNQCHSPLGNAVEEMKGSVSCLEMIQRATASGIKLLILVEGWLLQPQSHSHTKLVSSIKPRSLCFMRSLSYICAFKCCSGLHRWHADLNKWCRRSHSMFTLVWDYPKGYVAEHFRTCGDVVKRRTKAWRTNYLNGARRTQPVDLQKIWPGAVNTAWGQHAGAQLRTPSHACSVHQP